MEISAVWFIDTWHLSLRLFLAVVLGGLIGLEREFNNHAAGFRTHILVCIGAALIMLLSIYGFSSFVNELNVRVDPSRLAAQVISGIGFLGAGTIIRNGVSISGLTTAASLWVTAGIGLAVGAGFYPGAFIGTFLVLVSLFLLNKTEKWFGGKHRNMVKITVSAEAGLAGKVLSDLEATGIQVKKIYIPDDDKPEENVRTVVCSVQSLDETKIHSYATRMMNVPGFIKVETSLDGKRLVIGTARLGAEGG